MTRRTGGIRRSSSLQRSTLPKSQELFRFRAPALTFHDIRDACPNRLLNRIGSCQEVLVLPEPQNSPPLCAQPVVGVGITGLVASQFLLPPGAVVLGVRAVLRAPVPEASVDKHCHSRSREEKICSPAWDDWQRGIHPVTQASAVDFTANSQLRRGVPARIAGHPAGELWLHDGLLRERWHKWSLFLSVSRHSPTLWIAVVVVSLSSLTAGTI